MSEEADLDQLLTPPLEQVEDVEELEILAFLTERPTHSTATEIAAAIHFPAATTLRALERLAARGFISCSALQPPLYRLGPASEAAREQLGRLVAAYRGNPLAVMRLMSAKAIDRVRTAALRTFADCFRIGGPKPNG